jgi:hypothetical protein
MSRYLEPQQLPSPVSQNYKHEQKVEGQRLNNTQINSGYRRLHDFAEMSSNSAMVACRPVHVFRDRRLGDFEPKHQKLTVNSGRTPQRVVFAHSLNEFAQAAINPRPPCPISRSPSPKGSKTRTMPTQDGLRQNHLGRTLGQSRVMQTSRARSLPCSRRRGGARRKAMLS